MTDSDMAGDVVFVTGATNGIGRETARKFAHRGATLVIHGRGKQLMANIEAETGQTPDVLLADFSSLDAVRKLADVFCERYDRLDVLVNNAACSRQKHRLTDDDIEETFAVNYLAPYLLTHDLIDRLRASASSRIVMTTSTIHRCGEINFTDLRFEADYDAFSALARSKLANVLFTSELATRLDGTGVTANAVDPGFVPGSRLYRNASLPVRAFTTVATRVPFLGTSPTKAADDLVYLAAAPAMAEVTGTYYEGGECTEPDPRAHDERLREQLWNVSAGLVGVAADWPS